MGEMIFLSGLPRTGSTLLTSILSQNPKIHTEGNSALCQLMWDLQVSCWNTEQMQNRPDLENKLLSNLPELFYENAQGLIFDKCRSWTLPANLDLIHKYITKSPKIIVMLRPILDIVRSFVYVRQKNNWQNPESGLLDEGSEPIMRSLLGVHYVIENEIPNTLFINYDDLILNPKQVLNLIYAFCEIESFEHNFDKIINPNPENDENLNMLGLHQIRPKISKREIKVNLSKNLLRKAKELDDNLRNFRCHPHNR